MATKRAATLADFAKKGQALLLVIFAALAPAACAQQTDVTPLVFNVSASLFSDYMFRGVKLYDGASFQPSASLTYSSEPFGSLSAAVWMHVSAEGDTPKHESFSELDATLSYERPIGSLTLMAGTIFYTFPGGTEPYQDTAEVYVGARFDTVFHPALTVYQNYVRYDAQYYELSIHQPVSSQALGNDFLFSPFVALGWATNVDHLYSRNGLEQITYGIFADVPSGKVTVTPYIAYTQKLDRGTSNQLWFGVSLALAAPVGPPDARSNQIRSSTP